MMAGLTRAGLLLLVIAACATAAWVPSPWAWLLALALPGAVVGSLGVVLALEFTFANAVRKPPHAPAPPLRTWLRAWWTELWAMCRLMVWRMPFIDLWQRYPSSTGIHGHRGMVLIHGYGCNRGIWMRWLAQLEARRVPCIAIDLQPIFAAIPDYGPLIETAVAQMQKSTGLPPVVVAHSMGGLAARSWWATDPSAQRLHRLITIATPHQGTQMARFGAGPGAQQMRPQSEWLRALQARETPAHRSRILCLYTACDNVVIPMLSATLPGAQAQEVDACAHVAIVDHPDCFQAALRCLRGSD